MALERAKDLVEEVGAEYKETLDVRMSA